MLNIFQQGQFGRSIAGLNRDAFFSSVQLLAHCDGTNGSTTFIDSSSFARTLTASGGVTISTTSPKFGTGALLGSYISGYLNTANNSAWDFGTGDFTVECWVRRDARTGNHFQGLVCHDQIGGTRGWLLYLNDNSGTSNAPSFAGWSGSTPYTANATTVLTVGQYYHLAAVRNGTTLRMYVDGVQEGTASIGSNSIGNPSEPLTMACLWGVGAVIGSTGLEGRMDDVRITKGVCRYPSGTTFTPPTKAFPDA